MQLYNCIYPTLSRRHHRPAGYCLFFPYQNLKLYKWIHPTLSRRHHRPAGDQRILLWRGINHRNWWWQGSYYQPQWHPWLKPMNSSLVDYKYRQDGQKCHVAWFFKGFHLVRSNPTRLFELNPNLYPILKFNWIGLGQVGPIHLAALVSSSKITWVKIK